MVKIFLTSTVRYDNGVLKLFNGGNIYAFNWRMAELIARIKRVYVEGVLKKTITMKQMVVEFKRSETLLSFEAWIERFLELKLKALREE